MCSHWVGVVGMSRLDSLAEIPEDKPHVFIIAVT